MNKPRLWVLFCFVLDFSNANNIVQGAGACYWDKCKWNGERTLDNWDGNKERGHHWNRESKVEIETEIETKRSEESKVKEPRERNQDPVPARIWMPQAWSLDWWPEAVGLTEAEVTSRGSSGGSPSATWPHPASACPMGLGRFHISFGPPNFSIILQLAPGLGNLSSTVRIFPFPSGSPSSLVSSPVSLQASTQGMMRSWRPVI